MIKMDGFAKGFTKAQKCDLTGREWIAVSNFAFLMKPLTLMSLGFTLATAIFTKDLMPMLSSKGYRAVHLATAIVVMRTTVLLPLLPPSSELRAPVTLPMEYEHIASSRWSGLPA